MRVSRSVLGQTTVAGLSVVLATLFGLVAVKPAAAQLANGGFETGSLSPFTASGNATIQTSAFGSGPVQGNFDALISNGPGVDTGGADAVSAGALETFLSLAAGKLTAQSATTGSAIKQTFSAASGSTLFLNFNFLTNESTPSTFFNDFAFLTLQQGAGPVQFVPLADTTSPGFVPSNTFDINTNPFAASETGFRLFDSKSAGLTFAKTGSYTLGLGVVNVNSSGSPSAPGTEVTSALLVDGVSVVPLPGAVWAAALCCLLAAAFALRMRRSAAL